MRRWRRTVAVVGAGMLLGLGARVAAAAPTGAETADTAAGAMLTAEQTRALFVRATDAADAGDLETARALYAELWSSRQTYDVAMNLAEIEAHLGRQADAATHAAAAIALFPPSEDPATRQHLGALLARARQGLGEITVEAPAGSRVAVDGVFVGTSPLSAPIFVQPGARRFEASTDERSGAASLVARRDIADRVVLRLDEPARPSEAATTGQTSAPDAGPAATRPHRGSAVPLLASAGIAVIGTGLGVGFALAAQHSRQEADDLDTTDDNRCTARPTPTECNDLLVAGQRVDRYRTATAVSFAGAGVGLVATGLFAVLRGRHGADEASLRPTLVVGIDGVAVGMRGSLPVHRGP